MWLPWYLVLNDVAIYLTLILNDVVIYLWHVTETIDENALGLLPSCLDLKTEG